MVLQAPHLCMKPSYFVQRAFCVRVLLVFENTHFCGYGLYSNAQNKNVSIKRSLIISLISLII